MVQMLYNEKNISNILTMGSVEIKIKQEDTKACESPLLNNCNKYNAGEAQIRCRSDKCGKSEQS